jgi:D-alanyl-D-alanine carboxypeptidase
MSDITERLGLLGIKEAHYKTCLAPKQKDVHHLDHSELDIFDRQQFMTGDTFESWQSMKNAAKKDDVVLQLVSAYRSIDYQCDLIQGKLNKGSQIDDILKVNAIPGYSEHHTGRALDLTTPGYDVLEECFEHSDAFEWLNKHAHQYHFTMSYHRNNAYGINYEPWHWFYRKDL